MSVDRGALAKDRRMNWIPLNGEESDMNSSESNAVTASSIAKCSLCGHPFQRSESRVFPFCSVRCQQVDLGLWLDEKLGLPVEGQEEQEFHGHHPSDDED